MCVLPLPLASTSASVGDFPGEETQTLLHEELNPLPPCSYQAVAAVLAYL